MSNRIWARIESRMKTRGENLRNLSEGTAISYDAIRSWRSKQRAPDLEALISFAKYLNMSLDFLVLGDDHALTIEQKYLEDHPEARALVRLMMDEPELLPHISALVMAGRKTLTTMEGREA